MLIRAFCAYKHDRAELIPRRENLTSVCPTCSKTFTRETLYRSLPESYKSLVDTDLGGVLATFADIGAIDLIFTGKHPLDVEYPREKDL